MFLELLRPYTGTEISRISLGEQQRIAKEQFPNIVAQSHLHYWRYPMPVESSERRLLLGLAASYSLMDLALADVAEQALAAGILGLRVDVFNLDDIHDATHVTQYFPSMAKPTTTPLAGLWIDGMHCRSVQGYHAYILALAELKSELSPHELRKRVDRWVKQ